MYRNPRPFAAFTPLAGGNSSALVPTSMHELAGLQRIQSQDILRPQIFNENFFSNEVASWAPSQDLHEVSSTIGFNATNSLHGVTGNASNRETFPVDASSDGEKHCSCILCYFPGYLEMDPFNKHISEINQWHRCCFPGCREVIRLPCLLKSSGSELNSYGWCLLRSEHEKNHYRHAGKYICSEGHCSTLTKSWSDLLRHYGSRHCTRAKRFPCPVPYCKYSGDNGFARKDKLKSHQKNVHKGFVPSAARQGLQPILPAPISGNLPAGSGASPSGGANAGGRE